MKQFFYFLLCVAVSCPAASAQFNWQPTNGPEGGALAYLSSNDQYAFYVADHFLFRTADGANWERLPYGNLRPLAFGDQKIAALQRVGANNSPDLSYKFLVSYNDGSTWLEGTLPPTQFGGGFAAMAICSHGIYALDGVHGELFRSQDDGLTWDTIAPPNVKISELYAFDDRLYAQSASQASYWRLSDNGANWELVSPAFDSHENASDMFAFGTYLFFATSYNMWSSEDAGVTWHKKNIPNGNGGNFIRIGNRIYRLGGPSGLVYTDDFGVTWNEIPQADDYSLFYLSTAGGKLLAVTFDKGVFYFDETDNQFKPANKGLNSATVYDIEVGDSTLWAACGNGVFAYDLATEQWMDKASLPIPNSMYKQVTISKSGKIAVVEAFQSQYFYLSLDKGISWKKIFPGNVKRVTWLQDVLVISGENASEGLRSVDFGQTWQAINQPFLITQFNGKYFGLYDWAHLVSSNDLGLTWQNEQDPVTYTRLLYSSGDRLFTLSTDEDLQHTALYSSADGITWKYANDGLPELNLFFDFSYFSNSGNVWNSNGNYYLYGLGEGFFVSLDTCKTWLPIQRSMRWDIDIVDTTLFSGGRSEGVLKSALPQNYGSLSSGTVFKDDNSNGIKDPGEIVLPHFRVEVQEPNAWFPFWFTTTNAAGHYALGTLPGGSDTLRVNTAFSYIDTIIPPYYVVNSTNPNLNFGVHFTQDITDVSISGNRIRRPRPGFDFGIDVHYVNDGTLPATGVVSVKLDPAFQYVNAVPAPSSVFGDSLVWNYTQLPLFERRHIIIDGLIAQTVPLGSAIKTYGYISVDGQDRTPRNNYFVRCDTVVGSYDPNEKTVEPAAGLTPAQIAAGEELFYTIEFQNTGTYEAERVRITDRLDKALNLTTLRLVSASHDISRFQLLPGGLLEVVFDHIALPDSNANEVASHGFVTFAIQRNKAFAAYPYNIIRNKAAIYFDFNEPIITNTVTSGLILTPVGTDAPEAAISKKQDLLIAPNPTDGYFTVTTKKTRSGVGQLTLLNTAGQVCFQQSVKDVSQPVRVNAALLADGFYIVRISDKAGLWAGKLLLQH